MKAHVHPAKRRDLFSGDWLVTVLGNVSALLQLTAYNLACLRTHLTAVALVPVALFRESCDGYVTDVQALGSVLTKRQPSVTWI